MNIVTVVGARPQFIKSGPVSAALREVGLREVLLHTGQHYDHNMSQVFFEELGLKPPDHDLGVGPGPHGAQTADMLRGIEAVLLAERPDLVLVYGDTNSTLAGALSAVKLRLPVAHVEAGLRSFNRRMPEEINRVLTDHASSLLFPPTPTALRHLEREGLGGRPCFLVGDVMYDAALRYMGRAGDPAARLAALGLTAGPYSLLTLHRAETADDPASLLQLTRVLSELAREVRVVCPLHPRTEAHLSRLGLLDTWRRALLLLPPVGYLDMLVLERSAERIITDSGGVQKEAFFHRVPCVTLRGETEWTELVELGWNRLVPLAQLSVGALLAPFAPETRLPPDLYGGGHAAGRIAGHLTQYLDSCAAPGVRA